MLSRRAPESFDERVLRIARTWGHTPARDQAVERFSLLGEHAGVWLAIGAGGAAVDRGRRSRWLRATATVGGMYALNTALKLVVRRRRPQLRGLRPLTPTATALSFPSAHASTAFAGALAYSRLGAPAAPLYALAAGLSYSRLYLGVHYPSDVLAGALLGTAVAAARADGRDRASSVSDATPAHAQPSSNGHVPSDAVFVAGGPA
ncbi:MAG TPA: phosphatase PAP2 family protein [Solirubrobacteraceae bacterium]|nr:phosphatase PAP2 family protein [Solirubrobacteraceae bacterium]